MWLSVHAYPSVASQLAYRNNFAGRWQNSIVFQAVDPSQIAEIDRITLIADRRDVGSGECLAYFVDPTKLSGFGAARPRRFNVRLFRGKTETSYINDDNTASPIKPDDLSQGTPFPLLRLDRGGRPRIVCCPSSCATDKRRYGVRIADEPALYRPTLSLWLLAVGRSQLQ